MPKKIPVQDTRPSLEAEILSLIDQLIARLGMDEYCKWLAASPVAWVLAAPYETIRDGLQCKLPAPPPAPARLGDADVEYNAGRAEAGR